MKRLTALIAVSTTFLGGCAEKSSDIAAAYVSPTHYQNFSCRQISEEAKRLSSRVSQATGAQDKKAKNDATAVAVGTILFWPALFFIKGDSETAAELSRLKGEMEALEKRASARAAGSSFVKRRLPLKGKTVNPSSWRFQYWKRQSSGADPAAPVQIDSGK